MKKIVKVCIAAVIIGIGLLGANFSVIKGVNDLPPVLDNQNQNPGVAAPAVAPVPAPPEGDRVTPPSPAAATPPPPGVPPVNNNMVPPPPLNNMMQLPDLNIIPKVINTARIVTKYLRVGKIWKMQTPMGEILKCALVYKNRVVTVVHINPASSSFLPLGYDYSINATTPINYEMIKNNLNNNLASIKIAEAVEYRAPERVWIIPLTFNGMKIGDLKINSDGSYIIPDIVGEQEMQAWGR